MKYFIIAGEASGDLHGSKLIEALKQKDASAQFQFWGGDLMAKASGIAPKKHIQELAIMGFWEVLIKLPAIKKNFSICKQQINDFNPDAVIFIDYPGFNLRMASFAKKIGLKTFYYISPKVWAWKQKRALKIKKNIDRLFSILPFEVDFYNQFDYPISYVGNPLMDGIEKFKSSENQFEGFEKPTIALLPGSRNQEIRRMLPLMLEVTSRFDEYNFVIAGASGFEPDYYESFFQDQNFEIIYDNTYNILTSSQAALVTSGTATLETGLLNIPQVVCYKTSPISYIIGKNLVKVKYASLVNLILNKEAVKELIQGDLTVNRLSSELKAILEGSNRRVQILQDYQKLQQEVGGAGASARVANEIIHFLKSKEIKQ